MYVPHVSALCIMKWLLYNPLFPPPTPHRAATEDMLIKARQDQIHHKEHFLAVQAQRDREEFERVLRLV